MDVDVPDGLLFRSSSPLCFGTDETDSLLLSQELRDLDAEDDHHLFDDFDDHDQDEILDSAVERGCSPVLLEADLHSRLTGEQARCPQRRASVVANKIESIFDDVCKGLNSGRDEVELVLSPCYSETDPGEHSPTSSTVEEFRKTIAFPGRNREEAWRFGKRIYNGEWASTNAGGAVLSRILELILETLTTGVTITKR